MATLASATLGASQPVHVLVVRATWGPTPPGDVAAAVDGAARFVETAALGQVAITTTTTPWVDAYTDEWVCTEPADLIAQAQAASNTAGYDRVVIVTPCHGASFGSPTTGIAVLFSPVTVAPVTVALAAHELGHRATAAAAGARSTPTATRST